VDENQVVIAAEVTVDPGDFGHLEPIVDAARSELKDAGVSETPAVLLADAGYWHQAQMQNIVDRGIHDLRHTYGSLLAAAGVDLVTIQSAMGHSALATTGRYLHARPATGQAAVFTRAFQPALPLGEAADAPVRGRTGSNS
jgi:Phage integrase family